MTTDLSATRMSEAPHRGGEGLQRHWVGAVLGVLGSAHRLLGLGGQLAVAHHRHALEQTRLGHQDIDGVGVDRLEQGVQRGVGLLVRQAHEVRSGLEGLLHRTGVEVHHARTISTTEVSRAVPDHVDIDSLAIIGPAARAGRVQVHGQGNHHDVVGDHGRPHCDLQTRPHSRHRPGHALTRTTRGTSRARRRCAGRARARARAARRRRRRDVGALAPRPPGRLTTGQGQQPHAGQDEPERNMRRRIVTGPFSCS